MPQHHVSSDITHVSDYRARLIFLKPCIHIILPRETLGTDSDIITKPAKKQRNNYDSLHNATWV